MPQTNVEPKPANKPTDINEQINRSNTMPPPKRRQIREIDPRQRKPL